MLIQPFIYPISSPILPATYEIPYNSCMAYSRTDPDMDTFYIPSRLIPGYVAGHYLSFQAPHANTVGLFPAFQACSHIYLTTNQTYAHSDTSTLYVTMIVTESSVNVGYIDIASGLLVLLTNLPLTEHPTITEGVSTSNDVLHIKRVIPSRYTLAPNNLPTTVTANSYIGYGPHSINETSVGTIFCFMDIKMYNPYDEEISVLLTYANGSNSYFEIFKVAPQGQFIHKHQVVMSTETVTATYIYNGTSALEAHWHVARFCMEV